MITIVSDVTGKVYTGTDYEKLNNACIADDNAYNELMQVKLSKTSEPVKGTQNEVSDSDSKNEMSRLKKQMSKEIESAKNDVSIAKSKYAEAKKSCMEDSDKLSEELATIIANAKVEYNKAVEEARNKYDAVLKDARTKFSDNQTKIREHLSDYEKDVKTAEQKKWEAIRAFNEKFGCPYEVRYTDDKAIAECNEALKFVDDLFNSFNKGIFSFL